MTTATVSAPTRAADTPTEQLRIGVRRDGLAVTSSFREEEALSPELIEELYPFSSLQGGANVLIFPDLASANLACKFPAKVGGGELIGPILMGMSVPRNGYGRGGRESLRDRRCGCAGKRYLCASDTRMFQSNRKGLEKTKIWSFKLQVFEFQNRQV